MKEKLTSRKFWLALLSNIVSIMVIFTNMGGTVGIVCGMVGIIAASISYMIAECTVDVAKAKHSYDDILKIIQELKGGE